MRLRRLWLGVLTALCLFAACTPAQEDAYLLLTETRNATEAPPVWPHPDLFAEAQRRAQRLADTQVWAHTVDLTQGIPPGWSLTGENIGRGGDIEAIHQAFIESPDHYANMVNPRWDFAGVGVVYQDGTYYVVHVFADYD